jgi:UDP-N-acetylmuramoylalanine--D-glutamate ligase
MLGLEDKDILVIKGVKGALLAGEASEGTRAAWGAFTPCAVAGSLLEAVAEAAINATSGDVVLLSPAHSSWNQFQNHQNRGEVHCQDLKSIGRGARGGTPNIHGKTVTTQQ